MRSLLVLVLLSVMTPTFVRGQSPNEPRFFPELRAENLLGESLAIPSELPGSLRLVFVAFRQRQQPRVNTWLAVGDQLEADYPGLRYFEFPTIAWPYRIMKPVIDNGMRSGIAAREARARTITLFTNVGKFVEATGLPGTSDIAILLLDEEGRIRWRATGRHTADAEAALREAIEGVR